MALLYLCLASLLGIFIHGDWILRTVQDACFVFVILNFVVIMLFVNKSADFVFTAIALFFTIVADRILTYNVMELIELGITFFTFTQISYFFKNYYQEESKIKKIAFCIALPVFILSAIIVASAVVGRVDYLTVIALTYFSFLVISCIFAFTRFTKNPLFALGLLLFIGCDVVLGGQVIGLGGSVGDIILTMDCWWFYFPSQILIVLSMFYVKLTSRGEKNEE